MRTDAQWAVLESAAAFLAALELAALVARINLVTEDGELDVHSAASSLLRGMAAAGDTDEDSDYDVLVSAAALLVF